ncbi:MAG TPA: hypothetical protein VFA08_08660 [Actinomycetota bacterium]|jgi:hypothetical protein|nr:hypothetical protein [Actinomycetota bacterium]
MDTKVMQERSRGVRVLKTEASATSSPRVRSVDAAVLTSAIVAALMLGASVLGIVIDDLYREAAWAREAFRGGDIVTLVLVVPVLITSLVLARRGSVRATVIWIGALAYSIYNYAYYVFGASFNDAFLIHIAIFSASIFALVMAASSVDVSSMAERLRGPRLARWIGGFLVLVGVGQGGLWVFIILRYVATGEVLADIPVRGQHVVFALDLSLLVPALVVSGVLLWRRTPIGYVAAGIVSVMGSLVLLNLLLAAAFQANADVAGVKAFPVEGVAMTVGMVASALLLLVRPLKLIGGNER